MNWESLAKKLVRRFLPPPLQEQIRTVYRDVRSVVRAQKRDKAPVLTAEELNHDLRAGGIRRGDVIMVHSALSKLGNLEAGAETVIESLLDSVGAEGTVLMPAFSNAADAFAAAARGTPIDLRTAPSQTGKITEVFRRQAGVKRSSHPFSSVCAWGKAADFVTGDHAIHPAITHAASPIGRLLELGGKVVGLGVTMGPVSFYHVLEDTWAGFPLRVYMPDAPITYIDTAGNTVSRPVRRFDPEVSRTRIDQLEGEWIRERFREHFLRIGLMHTFRYGGGEGWYIETRPFYDELKRLAQKGVTIYLTQSEAAEKGLLPTTNW